MFWPNKKHSKRHSKEKKNKTVFVGLSGGVDSSVTAKVLKDQGYEVVGAFMKTWYPNWLDCDWKQDRRDAMRVCARLDIPFVEYDLEEAYFNEVGQYLVNEYKAGRTPNPDIMCNRHVKFGNFWQAAQTDGADLIATGHYARVRRDGKGERGGVEGEARILAGVDEQKDQTYFLWGIERAVVSSILFPIGDWQKPQVRKIAKQANLITADKPDSQGICFLGEVEIEDFLSHYLDLESGPVLDSAGQVIGTHKSAYIYTVGQRHGFVVNNQQTDSEALFVIEKDVENNVLVVGTKEELEKTTQKKQVSLIQTNWLVDPEVDFTYQGRFRYRQPLRDLQIKNLNQENNTAQIVFAENQSVLVSGQSLVVYNGEQLIGGGVIE